jgi:hypothetical protein
VGDQAKGKDMTWIDVEPFAKAIGGPLVGFIFGSLLTSYVQWGFEKKKRILQRRRELVTGWRMNLLPLAEGREVLWLGDRKTRLLSSPYYASLRPHLTAEAIKELEHDHLKLMVCIDKSKPVNDWAYHFPVNLLVQEIGRIEKRWKLV